MTQKVVLTVGLPGSGKTTWALQFMADNPGWKRINKDSLRAMLDGGKWTSANEKFVLKMRDFLIMEALVANYNVIVDDTNLDPKHLQQIEKMLTEKNVRSLVTVSENRSFLDVPLETCIANDLKRFDSVGEAVIRKMWKRYLAPKIEPPIYDRKLPDALIVDLDGTLAIHGDRGPFEWARVGEDICNTLVRNLMDNFQTNWNYEILIVSGRDNVCRAETESWLTRNYVARDALWMRAEGDMRDDRIVKEEIYRQQIEGNYNVKLVLDDRNKVVDFWRSLGLVCWQVAEGDF